MTALDRSTIEAALRGPLGDTFNPDGPAYGLLLGRLTDAVFAAQTPPEPAPRPVWPGLEGEGLQRTVDAWGTAQPKARPEGMSWDDVDRLAYTAVAAHLWRAMVASLPTIMDWTRHVVQARVGVNLVSRADLAALADPYDGGGKS